MTPLTHAAVGMLIYQRLRKLQSGTGLQPVLEGQAEGLPHLPRWRYAALALALSLAFLSHYLLDAIPHFEQFLSVTDHQANFGLMFALGSLGVLFSLLVMRWNREAGLLWLVLSAWVGVGGYEFSPLRILTALVALAYVTRKSRIPGAAGCVLAGMMAIAPDLLPESFATLSALHIRTHYDIDWATRLFLQFSQPPIPRGLGAALRNPYMVLGFGLELLVEGCVFLGAVYLFARQRSVSHATAQIRVMEPVEVPLRNGEPAD